MNSAIFERPSALSGGKYPLKGLLKVEIRRSSISWLKGGGRVIMLLLSENAD